MSKIIEESIKYQSQDSLNPLSVNFTKLSNTLKQIVDNWRTICLSVFDYFVELALKGLKKMVYCTNTSQTLEQIFFTDSCLAQLMHFVLPGMDKGMHSGMIFIDLQKAFDLLDHKILENMTCL